MDVREKNETIWRNCLELCHKAIQKSIDRQEELEQTVVEGNIEYAIQSKFLPRGVYCPSPDLEHIVTNMRRGKLVKQIKQNTKITNCYRFDANGRLRIAETIYTGDSVKREFLYYEDNLVYGAAFDSNGGISEISIEEYEGQQIKTYLWASCIYQAATKEHLVLQMLYEVYSYGPEGILISDFYNMSGTQSAFTQHQRYEFKNGDSSLS